MRWLMTIFSMSVVRSIQMCWVNWTMQLRAKKANTWVDYQELIVESNCAYQIWETNRKKLGDDGIETDVAFSEVNFRGRCIKCGKIGHKTEDCTNLNESNSNSNGSASNLNWNSTGGNENSSPNKNRKFQGKCNHCGAKGHKEADCWQKEENAHKHPKNWKRRVIYPYFSDVNVYYFRIMKIWV